MAKPSVTFLTRRPCSARARRCSDWTPSVRPITAGTTPAPVRRPVRGRSRRAGRRRGAARRVPRLADPVRLGRRPGHPPRARASPRGLASDRLGFDPRDGVTVVDWLATPQQLLLETTAGIVHHDERGELAALRAHSPGIRPTCGSGCSRRQWRRIDQEEPFVGRAAEVGTRSARPSWLRASSATSSGSASCSSGSTPVRQVAGNEVSRARRPRPTRRRLLHVLSATDYTTREDALVRTLQAAAALRNERGATRPVDESVGRFHGRPFKVLGSGRFVDACLERVTDPRLAALPLVGGIDQLADSADLLVSRAHFVRRAAWPRSWLSQAASVAVRRPSSFAISCSAATTFAMCSSSSSPRSSAPACTSSRWTPPRRTAASASSGRISARGHRARSAARGHGRGRTRRARRRRTTSS